MSCSCSTEAASKRAVNRQPCFRAKSFSSMSKSQPRDTTHEWNRAMRRKWIEHNTVGKATRWRCGPMPKMKALNSPANWNLCFVNWNWKLKETYETTMKQWPWINKSSVPLTKKSLLLALSTLHLHAKRISKACIKQTYAFWMTASRLHTQSLSNKESFPRVNIYVGCLKTHWLMKQSKVY